MLRAADFHARAWGRGIARRLASSSTQRESSGPKLELPWEANQGSWSLRDKLLAQAPESEGGARLTERRLEELADLANLGLPRETAQREKLLHDLEAVLRFGDLVTEAEAARRNEGTPLEQRDLELTPLREDQVSEGDNKEALLSNAERSEDGHFVVYQKRP
ncbi:Glutamyl-tRNAGln amidotransferase subunit C, mitochondrial [Hondaea fermentalgiana]|uniref:Glutamyl-tRNAGln amidotransferase subunit C, mitochondrial n=1 Tax=Hondaea fermentalgiana TaxID=2315210 RepID=A0A2R5GRW8_9STRA|nr:Glutamyl-tRNAGln amidotransferase subunit C, mitochondrial [Hondaea fermentalgiana]|eukprot:GBG30624.1 Glutamyl-tRNAGln amidotransferase subunit C, mitochondrial [Hondaea fermentalgiana]